METQHLSGMPPPLQRSWTHMIISFVILYLVSVAILLFSNNLTNSLIMAGLITPFTLLPLIIAVYRSIPISIGIYCLASIMGMGYEMTSNTESLLPLFIIFMIPVGIILLCALTYTIRKVSKSDKS